MQVRAAADERAAALGAIVHKRQERQELVAGAAASPEVGMKGSPAAAVVLSALNRAKGAIAPASAAEFHAAAAPATAVGHLVLAPAVTDPEDAAAIAAAVAAAAEVCCRRCHERAGRQRFAAARCKQEQGAAVGSAHASGFEWETLRHHRLILGGKWSLACSIP